LPDVEGEGEECGEQEEDEPVELGSDGGCCTCGRCSCAGAGAGAGAPGTVIVCPSG